MVIDGGDTCRGGIFGNIKLGLYQYFCFGEAKSKYSDLATLFNCLPKHIRNIVNCANPIMFKRALDNHLCSIEDSPMVL